MCWQSRLQPTVALSSTESEYMAAGAAAQELMWLRELLREIGFEQHGSTSIYEDNRSCINLSENPMFHKRTKHILVRYHYIQDLVQKGFVKLIPLATTNMIADILTKPLGRVLFLVHRDLLVGCIILEVSH